MGETIEREAKGRGRRNLELECAADGIALVLSHELANALESSVAFAKALAVDCVDLGVSPAVADTLEIADEELVARGLPREV
jgi:hypothetical protein